MPLLVSANCRAEGAKRGADASALNLRREPTTVPFDLNRIGGATRDGTMSSRQSGSTGAARDKGDQQATAGSTEPTHDVMEQQRLMLGGDSATPDTADRAVLAPTSLPV
jgi:hypothetical protein